MGARHLSRVCSCPVGLPVCAQWPAEPHGRDILLFAAQTICVIVDSKEVVGRRRRRRAGVHRHRPLIAHKASERSPLRPHTVGSGMAAGAAFGQRRVRDVGAVRSFSTLCNVNDPITHATRLLCSCYLYVDYTVYARFQSSRTCSLFGTGHTLSTVSDIL